MHKKEEGLKIPAWEIGIIVTFMLTIGGGLVAWGQTKADIRNTQQQVIELKDDLKEIQTDIKSILREVKK